MMMRMMLMGGEAKSIEGRNFLFLFGFGARNRVVEGA